MPIRLTTLPRVKELFESAQQAMDDPGVDGVIQNLIDEVSSDAEVRCNRRFEETTHIEPVDGDGSDLMFLKQGPLVSVASVNRVEYSTNPSTGALVQTKTLVQPGEYLQMGKRDEGSVGQAILRLRCGSWCEGKLNYEVEYDAGWVITFGGGITELPLGLVRAATARVAGLWNTRDLDNLSAVDVGDGGSRVASLAENSDRAWERALEPYRMRWF